MVKWLFSFYIERNLFCLMLKMKKPLNIFETWKIVENNMIYNYIFCKRNIIYIYIFKISDYVYVAWNRLHFFSCVLFLNNFGVGCIISLISLLTLVLCRISITPVTILGMVSAKVLLLIYLTLFDFVGTIHILR